MPDDVAPHEGGGDDRPRSLHLVGEPVSEQHPDFVLDYRPLHARTVLSRAQKVWVAMTVVLVVTAFVWLPLTTAIALNAAITVLYCAAYTTKLWVIDLSLRHPHQEVDAAPEHDDRALPVYTILLPLYHETSVLDQLVAGIAQLDYPHELLDVKVLLEEDDHETREAVAQLDLPAHYDVRVVPPVGVTGKPRACNHWLDYARGEYLVIYDAEDRPEPDQLRKAVAAFRAAGPETVCFQAKLNYFNRPHNILTRWFTAEYSVWFDQMLPGLQYLDVPIPLGGTSNHFPTARLRELGGWDSYNVTEDAELGVRIYLRGWKTAILDSTTYEEATSGVRNWVRQRSRWVKGYMQTYFATMRRPVALARQIGLKSFVMLQLIFGANSFCLLLNPFFWALTITWYATRLHVIQETFLGPVLFIAVIGLFVGNAACVLATVSGAFGRRHYEDVKWAFLVPFYWILMSIAAWKAFAQLFTKPNFWEKTDHGACRYESDGKEALAPSLALAPPAPA
jgi:cellulose synthase/poly-beta-1,6-N-acetylglucosamine synthase-like glycosyltransferase